MPGINTSSTLSSQYQTYFSKELLSYAKQALILDQFAKKVPLPNKHGNKQITMFRFGPPISSSIAALGEGTAISSANYRSLALSSITKTLAQYGQVIGLTDILTASGLFNALEQASKSTAEDAALHFDTITRNVLVGSSIAGTVQENGAGAALDNNDTINERYAGTSTTFTALNSDTAASSKMAASDVLDAVTNLKINRAPEIGGSYIAVVAPQVSRDMQRDNDWITAATRSNVQALYKGEIGSFYGVKFIETTNPFVSTYSVALTDRFIYSAAGTNSLAAGAKIYATLFLGGDAYGVPMLTGDSPMSPKVIITDSADKADPLNQTVTVGFKSYWATLRLNPNYYCVFRSKSGFVA